MRIIAILDGGDWVDASVDHIEIPDEMDLYSMRDQYREFRKTNRFKYPSFTAFLMKHGATETSKVEEYWNE